MKQLYGVSFTNIYGDEPSPIWEVAIAKLTDGQCKKGLATLMSEQRAFPANLTEFLAACKPAKPVRYLGQATSPRALLEHSPPKTDQAVAEKWLARIRARVRQGGVDRDLAELPEDRPGADEGDSAR